MTVHRATPRLSRSRAVLGLLLLAASLVASTLPAGAARPPWTRTTTTTRPTTTTQPTTTTTTTQPTTSTTTPAGPSCGGVTLAKPTGGSWVCTFTDEFDGMTLDRTRWVPQRTVASGFTAGGVGCFMDAPGNVSVSGGSLRLTVRREAEPVSCGEVTDTLYTAGSVMTYTKFSQTYGRFEIRAKFPDVRVKGLQGALWLWPDNPLKYGPWPYSGEIDIAEVYSLYADRAIPFLHYGGWNANVTNNYCLLDTTQFHTYVAEWTTTGIRILFDGKTCIYDTITPLSPLVSPQPFDHPFMIALTQNLGVTGNAFDPAVTPLPGTLEIDYVRVWK
ncbi:MAG TPA: glycoside hydrolase family 16 protein [Acidimicrobiales bacterium]|nr:glycoside hydrolase family 16 protein [Acidimicrobiales bacterium]